MRAVNLCFQGLDSYRKNREEENGCVKGGDYEKSGFVAKRLKKIHIPLAKGGGVHIQYLTDSIRIFPNQKEFAERIQKAGFKEVSYLNKTGGIVAIHIATKGNQ